MISEYWLKIDNKGYKLNPFDCPKVQDQIYSDFSNAEEPNGWKIVEKRTRAEDPRLWVEIAYIMLSDKTDFPKYEDFYMAVSTDRQVRQDLIKVVTSAVNKRAVDIQKDKKKIKKNLLTMIIGGICSCVLLISLLYFLGILSINL